MTKIVRDWTKLIIPRVNKNTNKDGEFGDDSFLTTDMISVRCEDEFDMNALTSSRKKSVTDYALMNNAWQGLDHVSNGKRAGAYMLRTADSVFKVHFVYYSGAFDRYDVYQKGYGICPSLSLPLPSKKSSKSISREIGEVKKVKSNENKRDFIYLTELGEYPKTKVDKNLHEELEELFNNGYLQDGLKCTGRLFTSNGQRSSKGNFVSRQNPEFEHNGNRYVRVVVFNKADGHEYEDGSIVPKTGAIEWAKVEPITFRITNHKDFMKGKAKELELDSDEIIFSGIQFHPDWTEENASLWQCSLARAFINSAKSSELDGNSNYRTPYNWDFRTSGFLYQALNMTRQPTKEYIIPKTEKEICEDSLNGCVGIEKIIIPPHVTEVGGRAFNYCVNSQLILTSPNNKLTFCENAFEGTNFKYTYLSKDGSQLILSPYEDQALENECLRRDFQLEEVERFCKNNYRENFVKLKTWKEEGLIKFLPPDYTIATFPSSEIYNYYLNNNNSRWGNLVRSLGFQTLKGIEKENSLVDLMKIYYAIGGFSPNQGESEMAYDYILNYVATTRNPDETPSDIGAEIHSRFSKINLSGAYNPVFAKFFMKYYYENPDFMFFNFTDQYGEEMDGQDYLCMAHNSFDRLLKSYPNRVVNGNDRNALLTPEFVAEHSSIVKYDYVDEGNETLAELIGQYGYTQAQFEDMQEIFNDAKDIKAESVISSYEPSAKNGIIFRVLEKDDPLGFILGDITNCCQHYDGPGKSCVIDGYKNPNAGFLVFEEQIKDEDGVLTGGTRILAQAYIWYDPETKTVCYDNIEMPKKLLKELKQGDKHDEFLSLSSLMDTVVESSESIMSAMNDNGIQVERVTTGQGYNNLISEIEDRFGSPELNPIAKNRGYTGYSDADEAQYLIASYDEKTQKYAETICETSDIINSNLEEIERLLIIENYEM